MDEAGALLGYCSAAHSTLVEQLEKAKMIEEQLKSENHHLRGLLLEPVRLPGGESDVQQ